MMPSDQHVVSLQWHTGAENQNISIIQAAVSEKSRASGSSCATSAAPAPGSSNGNGNVPSWHPNSSIPPSLQHIDRETIARYFNMPIKDAATQLGVGVTTLKMLCRSKFQISRWPFRSLKRLRTQLKELEARLNMARGKQSDTWAQTGVGAKHGRSSSDAQRLEDQIGQVEREIEAILGVSLAISQQPSFFIEHGNDENSGSDDDPMADDDAVATSSNESTPRGQTGSLPPPVTAGAGSGSGSRPSSASWPAFPQQQLSPVPSPRSSASWPSLPLQLQLQLQGLGALPQRHSANFGQALPQQIAAMQQQQQQQQGSPRSSGSSASNSSNGSRPSSATWPSLPQQMQYYAASPLAYQTGSPRMSMQHQAAYATSIMSHPQHVYGTPAYGAQWPAGQQQQIQPPAFTAEQQQQMLLQQQQQAAAMFRGSPQGSPRTQFGPSALHMQIPQYGVQQQQFAMAQAATSSPQSMSAEEAAAAALLQQQQQASVSSQQPRRPSSADYRMSMQFLLNPNQALS